MVSPTGVTMTNGAKVSNNALPLLHGYGCAEAMAPLTT